MMRGLFLQMGRQLKSQAKSMQMMKAANKKKAATRRASTKHLK
jgi:hypothetical protein